MSGLRGATYKYPRTLRPLNIANNSTHLQTIYPTQYHLHHQLISKKQPPFTSIIRTPRKIVFKMCHPVGKYYSCGCCQIVGWWFCVDYNYDTLFVVKCPKHSLTVARLRDLRSKCGECRKLEEEVEKHAKKPKEGGRIKKEE